MTPFNPTPNVSTHSDARTHFNNNFADAESRISSIEVLNLNKQYGFQEVSSSGGSLVFDVSNNYNGKTILTEDTAFSITGATAGDSGIIIFRQDQFGGWDLSITYKILSGNDNVFPLIPINGAGVVSLSWFFDGTEYFVYISNISV